MHSARNRTLRTHSVLVTLVILLALTALLVAPVLAANNPSLAANNAVDLPERVTWADDVAQVVFDNCASCHRPDDIAPMSLLTYDEARPWAKSMLRAIRDGVMPPWHADPAHGSFRNDRSLTERETALIERWVRQGARPGDLSAAPESPRFDGGWRLGEPDLIVEFQEVSLAGGGPDVFEDLLAEIPIEENQWLRALEVKPGNRRVLHHVILMASDGESRPSSGWLGAWAAGMEPMVFPKGTAKLLEPGQTLVGDMHYHPGAEPSTDSTQVGLYFYDGEPEKELINLWIQNSSFRIPAGAKDHVVRASHTFREDSTIHGLLPHMHYRGKAFTYTATYPDGRTETLLDVPQYDFNWQTLYNLEQPIKMPKGARIDCVAHFDNSKRNKANPDYTRDVTFGSESYDEMMIGFVDYTIDHGQRPLTAEEQIAKILADMSVQYPGQTWSVTIHDVDDGVAIPSALYLPESGDGVWVVAINGQAMEGKLTGITYQGNDYTATFVAPVGTLQVAGTVSGNTVAGKVAMGDGSSVTFEGSRR